MDAAMQDFVQYHVRCIDDVAYSILSNNMSIAHTSMSGVWDR